MTRIYHRIRIHLSAHTLQSTASNPTAAAVHAAAEAVTAAAEATAAAVTTDNSIRKKLPKYGSFLLL